MCTEKNVSGRVSRFRYLYNPIIYNLFLSCWESCLGHFQGFSILLITHVQASVYEMSIFYDKKQFIRFLVFLIPTFQNNFLEPKFKHAFSIVAHQVTQNSHTILALESKKVLFYLSVYFRQNCGFFLLLIICISEIYMANEHTTKTRTYSVEIISLSVFLTTFQVHGKFIN